jgi:hypothetical protein
VNEDQLTTSAEIPPSTAERSQIHKHYCAAPDCERWVGTDKWAKIKAEGWFFQKNGDWWCSDHTPEWVTGWRTFKADLEANDE